MGLVTDLQLEEVILHILDPPNRVLKAGVPKPPEPRGLVRSERPLPRDTDERIWNYFKNHIETSLRNLNIRAARFNQLEAGSAGICKGLLAADIDLVEGSQRLAESLYAIMLANRSISRGSNFLDAEFVVDARHATRRPSSPRCSRRRRRRRSWRFPSPSI